MSRKDQFKIFKAGVVRFFPAIMLAVTLATGRPAQAQSIYGPGGLFLNPTADFPAKGQLNPAFLVIPQEGPGVLGDRRTLTSYTLDYGVSDRLEAGITYLKVNPGSGGFEEGSSGGFAKYKLVEGRPGGRPDVAVGASLVGGGDVDARTAFVALRYTPRQGQYSRHPVHLHAGLLYADKLYGIDRNDVVPYAGLDVRVARNVTAFAEVRAKMEGKPSALSDVKPPNAVGLVWQPARNFKIAVAYANNGQSDRNKWSFGVGYALGFRR
jgi:hypothetical protein